MSAPGLRGDSRGRQDVVSHRKTGRVRIRGQRRTVGFYSSVGRKGRTRTVRVTFIDESGVKKTATTQD